MTADELVSIIIPTYYRNQYLRACLRSVFEQEYRPIQVIVVDDSGEAHAQGVVDEFSAVEYIPLNRNAGAQAARNRGFRNATGAYVQFLDDDDRLKRDKISKQVAILREKPDVGVVTCGIEYESGWVETPPESVRGKPLAEALSFIDIWRHSTLLMRYSTLIEIMPLDEPLEGAGDAKLGIELAQHAQHDFVDEPLVLAGEPDRRLGASWEALHALRVMMIEYERLYDQVDPKARRRARADINCLEGRLTLEQSAWSPTAILAFAKAAYHASGYQKLIYSAESIASLFGRPGHRAGSDILRRIRLLKRRISTVGSKMNDYTHERDGNL
jgi:glycosyltransferase involved in cell wall biosynthesis